MFGPLSATFHDATEGPASDAEIEWYASRLPAAGKGGLVLDGLCGSGRMLVPLARSGLHVHGVDNAAAMLAACESRAASAGVKTTLFRQDLFELNVPFRYAAAYVCGGWFQLVASPHAASAALARVKAHLVPPGVLLLDLSIPEAGLHPPGAPIVEIRTVPLADGARITLRTETLVDADARRLDVASRYEKRESNGERSREDGKLARTWYEEDDIVTLLTAAGFTDVAIEPTPRPSQNERRFAVRARGA